LNGDKADKIVFYISIFAFLSGGIIVKIGEYKEEMLRQKTIALTKFFEGRNLTFMQTSYLNEIIPESTLEDICYNYPNAFIKTSDSNIMCVDTIVTNKIAKTVYPLLESYLNVKLKNNCKMALDTIGIGEAWYGNIRGFFMLDIIYGFLSQPDNKGKYDLDVVDGRTIIYQGDPTK
jgi:hypothetical protein